MLVGPVVEVGPGVTNLALGDRVCAYSGFRNMAVLNERNCWKMGADMSWKSAVCLDPGEFALEAVRDSHLRIGDAVAVFGLGAIGLMVLQFCKLAGAYPIIALDPLVHRRAAAEQLGATLTLDPTACDAGLEIKKATGKRGVDVAIEYSGARAALQQALRGLAYGGTVLCGVHGQDSRGHGVTYLWEAEDGGGNPAGVFDDETLQFPTWHAPDNLTDTTVDYELTVTVACQYMPTVNASASFTVHVNPVGHVVTITDGPTSDANPVA